MDVITIIRDESGEYTIHNSGLMKNKELLIFLSDVLNGLINDVEVGE